MGAGLKSKLPLSAVHLCIDMQRMFTEDTAWRTPWAGRVLPVIEEVCARKADRTIFTRFIPATRPGEGEGMWRAYWERWASMTLEAMGPEMVDLALSLQRFVPPARILNKASYSPWRDGRLHAALREGGAGTLVVTGAETDVCVLATVLGAVDLGYRTVVVTDALCSSADDTHDKLIDLYNARYDQQVETTDSRELFDAWR
ncbi:cysteine hydrolase family protein [Brevundimonas sp. VNH65]|uniref:cysteine hydrolase family protein n=1 Tax=Brevundimonas sp. VNH65 TaxID=3400917 RepID=UPI003BFCB824